MTSPYVAPSGVPYPPPGSYMPPGSHAQPPQPTPPPRKRGLLIAVGLVIAILLATAALVVGIIAINRPTSSTPANRTPPAASPTTSGSSDTTSDDRQLCEAVGPLLRESNETGKAFVNLGDPGTPARDAGIPGYEDSVLDWVKRVQPVLDSHAGADPYLRRMLQRMVDDIHSYATSIRPGPETAPDAAAWNDASVAYGGPYDVCHRLGVQW
jgi:hypothetical protein